jgi:uncharacterized protein YbjT (DUF2867 family)
MIVVTTPTGHIGSQLLPHLLAARAPVRVIARQAKNLSAGIQSRVGKDDGHACGTFANIGVFVCL